VVYSGAALRSAPSRPFFLPTLAVLFFGSGVSALIYQVLWTRVLGWVFGVTIYAASAVWASFMAGLAIGSVVAGRVGDRSGRPLRWFGAAELLIGATALATPPALAWMQRAYVAMYPSLPHSIAALTAVRLVMAFALLVVPTALMGATLPLVIRSSELREGQLGEHIGVLYGSNTAGAIAGTLAAGLLLIPTYGIHTTFLAAAALNAVVGAAAIALSTSGRAMPVRSPMDRPLRSASLQPSDLDPTLQPSGPRLRAVLVVFGISGFVSLALEVVWFRVLTLFLRPTVYGFAIMLATILAGIAIGSYLVAPLLDRPRRWIAVVGVFELAIAIATALSFWPLAQLPALNDRLTPTLQHVMPAYLVFPLSGSLLAIFPTALLMGAAFPIGLRLWTGARDDSAEVASRVGAFYSLNVAGAILGSLAGGFLLLPLVGSRAALVLLAGVTFASGAVLLGISQWPRSTKAWTIAAAAAVLIAVVALSPDPFVQFIEQRFRGDQIVWREEGVEATVVVHRSPSGDLSMTVNGNHQASTDDVTAYVHRRIGHLPMALHPDPRTALVIGLGGGATAGAVSVHGPSVDVVELAGSVVRGAKLFERVNYGVLTRPNVRIRVDDGRNYLMLTPKRYDVVTADVIHPIYAGSGNLYSAEYFQLIRRVLNPGGMVMQWVAGTDAEYKIIARTFLSVFPETTVWADGSLLVGMVEPLRLRREDFERKLKSAGSAQGLHDLNVESWDRLLAAFVAGPPELRAFVGDGPILTDDKPLVEYFLSLPRDRDVDTSSMKGDVRRYIASE
jgi:spermidine synthase